MKVNCAALPHELLESELFGYEKGAFTGAQKRKLGKFEIANGGTIFLDEISEMHPSLQAKLLQVLQDGQFSRLGGHERRRGRRARDRRDRTATSRRRCAKAASARTCSTGLNVVTMQLPPLRERRDEIPILADHFLERYAREYGKDPKPLPDDVRAAFAELRLAGQHPRAREPGEAHRRARQRRAGARRAAHARRPGRARAGAVRRRRSASSTASSRARATASA